MNILRVKGKVINVAKSASMYIRIDPQVKSDVEKIYSQYGMSITDAINVFLYQSRNIGGLPFDLRPAKPDERIGAKSAKGILKNYANPSLAAQEKGAWENAAVEKHDSI